MSQTAQLLNLLAGLAPGAGASKAAPAGLAKPDANAPDGFLALLALAGANAGASATVADALPTAKTEAAEGKPKGLLKFAAAETADETDLSAQASAHAQAEKSDAWRPLLTPAAQVSNGLPGLLAPDAQSAEGTGDADMPGAAIADAKRAANVTLPAAAAQPKTATPVPPAGSLQESPATNAAPADGVVAAQSAAPDGQVDSVKSAATEQAATSAADIAAKVEAEVLAATNEAAKSAVAPTREAILNASLTSVASTLLGEKSTPAGTTDSAAAKAQTKSAGISPAATSAPKDSAPRNSAPPPAAQTTTQTSAPPPSDDLSARGDTAKIVRSADFALPQDQAPKAEGGAPAQANFYTPGQAAHAAVPVIVVRAAQGAQGASLPQDHVALAVVRQFHAGINRFEIRFDPPELGRIDVKMSVHSDGHVSAQLTADRPDTLALLQRDARVLQRALNDAGLQMDSGSLSFGLRDQGGRQVFDQGASSASYASTDPEEDEGVAALPYGVALTASLEPGRVDIRI